MRATGLAHRTGGVDVVRELRHTPGKRFGLGLDANDKWLKHVRDESTDEPVNVADEQSDYPIEKGHLRRKLMTQYQWTALLSS